VVEISSWLNAAKIDFLSMSTLDIRKRKVVGELLALLRFLDSPIDELSFTTFVTGELFRKNVPQIPPRRSIPSSWSAGEKTEELLPGIPDPLSRSVGTIFRQALHIGGIHAAV
jgi:hypothetical protein